MKDKKKILSFKWVALLGPSLIYVILLVGGEFFPVLYRVDSALVAIFIVCGLVGAAILIVRWVVQRFR